jgi:hypothetical protein
VSYICTTNVDELCLSTFDANLNVYALVGIESSEVDAVLTRVGGTKSKGKIANQN